MKKVILLVFTALMIVGCDNDMFIKDIDGVKVVTIDSCEYIRCVTHGVNYVYSHKGNCCFCKERRQKEFEELVIKLKEK